MRTGENTKAHVLYLDDEPMSLKIFGISFKDDYNLHLTDNSAEAIQILKDNEIEVFVIDQYMPDINGTELITKIREQFPDVICIILTGQSSKSLLITAINQVDVFWFLEKPLDKFDAKQAIDRGIEAYRNKKEKRELNNQLQKALNRIVEVEQHKKAFLKNLSHEIRTPLNGIVGFAGLLATNLHSADRAQEYFKVLNNCSSDLIDVVEDIISASNINSGHINKTDMSFPLIQLLENISWQFSDRMLSANLDFTIRCSDEHKNTELVADYAVLYEVFTMLIKNSFKFTKKGNIEFGLLDFEKQIFFVKDTGIGIDEQDKRLIFDLFDQGNKLTGKRKYGGLGLGLSIAKGLLDNVGGKIWFESSKGKGSAFYFTFPFTVTQKVSHHHPQRLTEDSALKNIKN